MEREEDHKMVVNERHQSKNIVFYLVRHQNSQDFNRFGGEMDEISIFPRTTVNRRPNRRLFFDQCRTEGG
jgi:hypothetical protein